MKSKVCIAFVLGAVLAAVPASADLVNLALNKTATQVSTAWGQDPYTPSYSGYLYASRAVDGDLNTISHTESAAGAWWQVDLGDTYDIKQIDIYNRLISDYGSRIVPSDVTIIANNTVVWTAHITTGLDYYTWAVPDIAGQIVRVQLTGDSQGLGNMLHMREVQVLGPSAPVPVPAAVWLLGTGLVGLIAIRGRLK
jgi:hypothetical protein